MVLFSRIASQVALLPGIYNRITQSQLLGFLDISSRFAPLIQPANPLRLHNDPGRLVPLPENIALVLSVHTKLPLIDIRELWRTLGNLILASTPGELVLQPGETDGALSSIAPSHSLGKPRLLFGRICRIPHS